MKKRFYFGALGLLTLGALSSCSSEDDQLKQQNRMGEYQISLGIGDLNTRVDFTPDSEDPNEIDECPDVSTVENLIKQDRLYANVEVEYEEGSHPQGLWSEEFELKLEKFGNGDMILQPMIVPVGTHNLTRLEIIDNNGTPDDYSDDKMVYSGVGVDSKYADFVQNDHLLPKEFTLTADQKLQKVKSEMTVLCAVNAIAADFGFHKWNTNFIKVYNIPFHVNTCETEAGHSVAHTTVNVYKGIKEEGRPETPIYTKSIEEGSTEMNMFVIIDEINTEDEKEYHWVEIIDNRNGNLIDLLEGTVADLKDPRNHPSWEENYEFIHYFIDGCSACDGYPEATTWEGETFDNQDITTLKDEGWVGLYTRTYHAFMNIEDKVKDGTLKVQQAPHTRFVYSPVFYVDQAGQFCIEGDADKFDLVVVPASAPTYPGIADIISGLKEDICGNEVHNPCVEICEPGCYRIQMRVHRIGYPWFGNSYVDLDGVTLKRLSTCD